MAPKQHLMSCNSKSKELYGRLLRAPPTASAARLRQQKAYNARNRLQRAIICCLVPRHQHGVCARSGANSGLNNGAVIVNVDAKMQQRQIRLGQASRYAHLRRHLALFSAGRSLYYTTLHRHAWQIYKKFHCYTMNETKKRPCPALCQRNGLKN